MYARGAPRFSLSSSWHHSLRLVPIQSRWAVKNLGTGDTSTLESLSPRADMTAPTARSAETQISHQSRIRGSRRVTGSMEDWGLAKQTSKQRLRCAQPAAGSHQAVAAGVGRMLAAVYPF